MNALKRNGCEVIYASYGKVLFATGKLRVLPDVQNFWDSFCENVKVEKVFGPLTLTDVSCLSELLYGVMWLDSANWTGIPIDADSGAVTWQVRSHWKMADFLPVAVQQPFILFIADLLVGPQRELQRKYVSAALAADTADVPDVAGDDVPMDVDAVERGCGLEGGDDARGNGGAEAPETTVAGDAAPADAPSGSDPSSKTAQVLEDLRSFIQGDFFDDLRMRVLKFVKELQTQQAREAPEGDLVPRYAEPDDRNTDSEQDEDLDGERKIERHQRHMKQKWKFPNIPGRCHTPGAVDFEFMRSLVQVFMLEECLSDQVIALKDRLCQKLKVSTFSKGVVFDVPYFPLVLRDVVCSKCCMASHVDVTSHEKRGPGLWVCSHCQSLYEKDAIQAQLVDLLNSVVQAWQAQDVVCTKCNRLKSTKIKQFCECYGRFKLRYNVDDFRLVLRMLRSLVVPNDLPWLGQTLDSYEPLMM
jgi:hypothetical protein